MITGYGAVTEAIEATKAGAFYFMEKPVEFEELMALIERAIERGRQVKEIEQLRRRLIEPTRYYNIIGSSRPMQRSEEHTSELQSLRHLVCRLLLEKKKKKKKT